MDAPWFGAFIRLSTCRQLGMDVGPIPWTAVRAYCRAEGMDENESLVFETIICGMDAAFLAHHRREQEREIGAGKAPMRKVR